MVDTYEDVVVVHNFEDAEKYIMDHDGELRITGGTCQRVSPVFIKGIINKMRLIKFYGGMTDEYEIIKTNAPDNIICAAINENSMGNTNPYDLITKSGYSLEIIGCQDDFDDKPIPKCDVLIDTYELENIGQ